MGKTEGVALNISARAVLWTLATIAVLLGLVSGIGRLLRWYIWPPHTYGAKLAQLFDVNIEYNIPSYYSAILILSCVPLLLYIFARVRQRGASIAWYWAGLAAIFLFLSMDEMIELHGYLNTPISKTLGEGSMVTYGWIIPYLVAVIAIGLACIPFLISLPRVTAVIFITSGFIYVLGAIGFELVAGFLVSDHFEASETHTYALATLSEHVEELLEMVGISLFLYGLLRHIREELGGLKLSIHVRS